MGWFILYVLAVVAIFVWYGWSFLARDFIVEMRMNKRGFKLYGDPGFSPSHWENQRGERIDGAYEAAREFLAREGEGWLVRSRRRQNW